MNTRTAKTNAESDIRELLDNWLRAVRAWDIDGIMSHYATDVRAFDAVSRLQFKGVDAYRKHWEACRAMCPGPMVFEVHELNIVAGSEVAFAMALNRCGGTGVNGEEKLGWMRMTACYRKIDELWKIAHEHFSVPFDMETCKPLFDLKP